jgi:hypothetical protein
MTESKTRTRRTTEEMLAELDARKEALLARAEIAKVKDQPTYKPARAAISAIDKGLSLVEDEKQRAALEQAREALGEIVPLEGIRAWSGRKPSKKPAKAAAAK